jgi:hypothetical protein
VRPSRRDPVVTELLVRALAEESKFDSFGGALKIVETVCPKPGDELHLYGSDESIVTITEGLPEGVVIRAHGTGIGIAVVGERVGEGRDLALAVKTIARGVGVFDQRGCLSPRFVLVEGDALRAEMVSVELHGAMRRFSRRYPRGVLDSGLQAEISRYRATMEAIGSYWFGPSHAVGFDPAPRALVLPPAARIVHVVPANAQHVQTLLAPWIRHVTAIGMNDEGALSAAISKSIPDARRSPLECMQRPLLDGPVDGRTQPIRVPPRH